MEQMHQEVDNNKQPTVDNHLYNSMLRRKIKEMTRIISQQNDKIKEEPFTYAVHMAIKELGLKYNLSKIETMQYILEFGLEVPNFGKFIITNIEINNKDS